MNAAPACPSALDAAIEHVRAELGLVIAAGRRASVAAGVRRALDRMGASDATALLAAMQGAGDVLDEIVAELTVGETYFFREPAQLDFLRREVLPAVVADLPPGEPIRMWSAGCSSGEEAYSLAILAEETGLGARTSVVGSDISKRALARAAEGVYGPWSLRGVNPLLVALYFQTQGKRHSIVPRVRARASFTCENLAARGPAIAGGGCAVQPGAVHVALCRNMLMYLEPEARDRAAERLFSALAPGGWLLTGPSDPALSHDEHIEPVAGPGGLAYRRSSRAGAAAWPVASVRAGDAWWSPPAPDPGPWNEELPHPSAGPDPSEAPIAEAGAGAQGTTAVDPVAAARAAFAAGEYARAAELAAALDGPEAAALRVQASANGPRAAAALDLATEMARKFPASAEVRCLHAALLLAAGRPAEALDEVRRSLYLDRTHAPARQLLRALRGDAARRPASLAGWKPG